MRKYKGLTETDIEVFDTEGGHVAIKGFDLESGKNVLILLSPRQARLIALDLDDFAKMAEDNFAEVDNA